MVGEHTTTHSPDIALASAFKDIFDSQICSDFDEGPDSILSPRKAQKRMQGAGMRDSESIPTTSVYASEGIHTGWLRFLAA